jgi:hypothetical protein
MEGSMFVSTIGSVLMGGGRLFRAGWRGIYVFEARGRIEEERDWKASLSGLNDCEVGMSDVLSGCGGNPVDSG